MANSHQKLRLNSLAALLATGLLVSGCAGSSLPSLPKVSDLNPFAEQEQPLPGKRVPVTRTAAQRKLELAAANKPVQLPAATPNASWSQPGGNPANAPGNLVFEGSGRRIWAADIGAGSGSRARLLASPIVADGKVFTMDAESVVSAFATNGGRRLWRVTLVPENERAGEGFGGGLAFADGRLYVATGFGTVVALSPGGKKIWEAKLGVPVRASPTAADGQVFVIATDGRAFNLNATDGSELWQFRGLPQRAGLIFNPSPAASGDVVVLPYPSGDVVAVKSTEGLTAWSDSVASTQTTSLGAMSDASRPAIANGKVYVIGHSGRMIASDIATGERLWSANIAGVQPPAVAGGNVFVVDLQGQVTALEAQSGAALWTAKLPGGKTWSGPVIASDRLWLTSRSGKLVAVDAKTGRVLTTVTVGEPVLLAPVIAGGTLFVLTDKGRLIAYR